MLHHFVEPLLDVVYARDYFLGGLFTTLVVFAARVAAGLESEPHGTGK